MAALRHRAVLFYAGGGHLAFTLVNWLAILLVSLRRLPRLDFFQRNTGRIANLGIVPTMLVNTHNVESLITDLEVRFLANRDKHLHFALLTDFGDAAEQKHPRWRTTLLQMAQKKIDALNSKYKRGIRRSVFLFHRPRLWNPQENLWMGYETKRGKLSDLNIYVAARERNFPYRQHRGTDHGKVRDYS